MPQIDVTFDIDSNGILSVSAQDKGTGKEQRIVIQTSSGLSDEDIERMMSEAEANEETDRQRRAEIETRNQADSLAYSAERLLTENAETLPADLKAEAEGKLEALKVGHRGQQRGPDADGHERAERSPATGGPGRVFPARDPADRAPPPGGADGGPDDTVEGEFREV